MTNIDELGEGDLVELTSTRWPEGAAIRGRLARHRNGTLTLSTPSGDESYSVGVFESERTWTLIEKAPKPFYVNHRRESPVNGDVVRGYDPNYLRDETYHLIKGVWFDRHASVGNSAVERLTSRRLLVDGETGEVVR